MATDLGRSGGGCAARLVWDERFMGYDFGPQHPLRPERRWLAGTIRVAPFSFVKSSRVWVALMLMTMPGVCSG